jgi:polyferredoxin
MAFVLFIRYIREQKNLGVLSGQLYMIRWLSVFLGFQMILITSYLFAVFVAFTASPDVFFGINFIQVLSAVGMTGLLVSPFFFPGILFGLPRVPDSYLK